MTYFFAWATAVATSFVVLAFTRKWWWAPIAGLLHEGLWFAFALSSPNNTPILIAAVIYTVVYAIAIPKWFRERNNKCPRKTPSSKTPERSVPSCFLRHFPYKDGNLSSKCVRKHYGPETIVSPIIKKVGSSSGKPDSEKSARTSVPLTSLVSRSNLTDLPKNRQRRFSFLKPPSVN